MTKRIKGDPGNRPYVKPPICIICGKERHNIFEFLKCVRKTRKISH